MRPQNRDINTLRIWAIQMQRFREGKPLMQRIEEDPADNLDRHLREQTNAFYRIGRSLDEIAAFMRHSPLLEAVHESLKLCVTVVSAGATVAIIYLLYRATQ